MRWTTPVVSLAGRKTLLPLLVVSALLLAGNSPTEVPTADQLTDPDDIRSILPGLFAALGGLSGIGGGAFYIVRKLVDSRIAKAEQQYAIEIESLRAKINLDQTRADNITALTESINHMSSVITSAYAALATANTQALEERNSFRVSLDRNTEAISSNSTLIQELRNDVTQMSELVAALAPMVENILTFLETPDADLAELVAGIRTDLDGVKTRLDNRQI